MTVASPADERLNPRWSNKDYLVLKPLAQQLRAAIAAIAVADGGDAILDVGCGGKPYRSLFAGRIGSYCGFDLVDGPAVDDVGKVEALPYEDASFDLVLCTQVLEHVERPELAVCEMYRVLRPGGSLLLSTHGVFLFHPDPPELGQDYWRWTHRGLQLHFERAGTWSSIDVQPQANLVATCGFLLAQPLAQVAGRSWLGPFVRAAFNRVVDAVDRRLPPSARDGAPGSIAANYLVIARKAEA